MGAADPSTTPFRAKLLAFARLGRPQFLVGGFVMYALGAAIALPHRALDLRAYVWGQAAVTATQLMTHYANDYFDLDADRANATATRWSGGSRVLPRGELAPRVAWGAAIVLLCVALALDTVVALRVAKNAGAPLVLVTALALSWAYSAPPFRLHSRGFGAVTVGLVVTCLTPMAGFLLQDGAPVSALALATLPLVCGQIAMILVIDFPDAAGDRAAGKRTLAVRLGARAAAWLCAGAVCAPYAMLPFLARARDGLPSRAVLAIVVTAPMAALLVVALARGDFARPSAWGRLTWLAVAWFALLAAGELAAAVSLALA